MVKGDPQCKDCKKEGVRTERVLARDPKGNLRPGPRCITHWRAWKKRNSLLSHAARTLVNYSISTAMYWALYRWQGGKCAICWRATGKTKRLAVDHEHHLCTDHPPEKGCPRCIRALLCGKCNQMIGWWDIAALERAIVVLRDAPARQFLANFDETENATVDSGV